MRNDVVDRFLSRAWWVQLGHKRVKHTRNFMEAFRGPDCGFRSGPMCRTAEACVHHPDKQH